MSATAQADLQKQVERMQIEIQRFTQDAQQEIQDLQNQLRQQFEQRIQPILAAGRPGEGPALHLQRPRLRHGLGRPRSRHRPMTSIKKLDAAAKATAK